MVMTWQKQTSSHFGSIHFGSSSRLDSCRGAWLLAHPTFDLCLLRATRRPSSSSAGWPSASATTSLRGGSSDSPLSCISCRRVGGGGSTSTRPSPSAALQTESASDAPFGAQAAPQHRAGALPCAPGPGRGDLGRDHRHRADDQRHDDGFRSSSTTRPLYTWLLPALSSGRAQ